MAANHKNTGCSWSGGKDSCFALMQAMNEGYVPRVLLNVLNESGMISRSHGIPAGILKAQAAAANIPIHFITSNWTDYESGFTAALISLKKIHSIEQVVFGDIDLQPHRDWEEKVCGNAGLEALLPLWKMDRKELVAMMIGAGINAMIVSCNESLGPEFLGRMINAQCISDLEHAGVDVCGENGEFHTMVLDCPLFSNPLQVKVQDRVKHEQYWFTKLLLQ